MSLHGRQIILALAPGQQPAMDARMQRLDPPVHHFGIAGDVGHVARLQPRIAQGLKRAAGGHQLHAGIAQRFGAFGEARLVGHRDQRAPDRHKVCVGHEG